MTVTGRPSRAVALAAVGIAANTAALVGVAPAATHPAAPPTTTTKTTSSTNTSTSTTVAATSTTPPERHHPRTLTVDSTAYCLTGRMANGQPAYNGAVAMNGQPFGSRWRVLSGPLAGRVFVVADRIHHGSDFDVAMPGDCQQARAYGRRTITVERIG